MGGRSYVYLVEGARSGKKVRQKTLSYLGPLSVLTFGIPESVKRMVQRKVRDTINWNDVIAKVAKLPVDYDEFVTSKRRRYALRARIEEQQAHREIAPTRAGPSKVMQERKPGELEALARLSKKSFESMFEQVGPLEYRLRE